MNCFLIVFAREPRKDMVKTRLRKHLSPGQCLGLYKAFLKDTLNLAKSIACDERVLAYESSGKPSYLKKIARGFRFYKQEGKDLGEKMYNAFKFARKNKADRTVIIGSDSPTLPAGFIEAAFRELDRSDIILGPSCDGGVYLIGLKRPCRGLFKDVTWGSGEVLAESIGNARNLKKKTALLERWYDIDDSVSLNRLKRDLKEEKNGSIAVWTRRFLKI